MNLANHYGEGNHHRISWREAWDVKLTATLSHRWLQGALSAGSGPGCLMEIATPSVFGPAGGDAIAQFGMLGLLKDGWEIFHAVAGKR